MLPICTLPFLQEPHPTSQMRKLRPRQSQWDLNSGLPGSRGLALTLKGGRVGGLLLKTVPSGPTCFCHSSGHVCGTLPDPGPPLTEGPGQGFRANEVRSQSDALWLWPCVWSRALARLQRASHHPGQGGAPALRGAELGSPAHRGHDCVGLRPFLLRWYLV